MRKTFVNRSLLDHRERIQACISNSSALDRTPVALWRHFPVDDQSPESLSEATIAFQSQFDFDFVKITPASSFCLKDWGVEDKWEGNQEGTRRYTKYIIENPSDWEELQILNPRRSKFLAAQLECIKLVRTGLSPETPIIQTIFSPLAQAKNMAGKEKLISHIHHYPEAVLKGLSIIAKTTRRFIEESIRIGIDGIFFAVQHAQASELTVEEYRAIGIPNDMSSLETADTLWCNVLHMHGKGIYFDLIPSYLPFFHVVNWHDRETPPTLGNARSKIPSVLCGGISQQTLVFGTQEKIISEAEEAFSQTNMRQFILGTGCVVPIVAPYGNILAIRQSVESRK